MYYFDGNPVPCMVCGEDAVSEWHRYLFTQRCKGCGLSAPVGETRDDAVLNWNELQEVITQSDYYAPKVEHDG